MLCKCMCKNVYYSRIAVVLDLGRSLFTKCVSLDNQPCTARPTLIDLNPNELHYYPFMVSLDRCDGNVNTVEDLLDRICVPNKIKDVILKVLNMIKKINDLKTLIKHISTQNGIMIGVSMNVRN